MIACGELFAAVSAAMSLLVVGINLSWPSSSLPLLMKNETQHPITENEGSWIVSLLPVGGFCGSLLSTILVKHLGKKLSLISASVFYEIGFLLIIFVRNKYVVMFSRYVLGLGNGIVYAVCPMYIAEVSSVKNRGILGGLMAFCMNSGILYSYCIGSVFSYKYIGVGCILIPTLSILCFSWAPETPVSYLMDGRRTEAMVALRRLRGKISETTLEAEMNRLERSVKQLTQHKGTFKSLVTRRGNRMALRATVCLVLTQQLSGFPAILSYASRIFEESKIYISPKVACIILGSVLVVSCTIGLYFILRIKRKTMLHISAVGCSISLTLQTVYLILLGADVSIIRNLHWLAAVFLPSYMCMYCLGLGSISPLMIGEMFPANVKRHAGSIASLVTTTSFFVDAKLFQFLDDNYGPAYPFGVFSVCCSIGGFFEYLWLPETKDKTLTKIIETLCAGPSLFERLEDIEHHIEIYSPRNARALSLPPHHAKLFEAMEKKFEIESKEFIK